MKLIATIPAVKAGKMLLAQELDVEQHRLDGTYLLSQERGSILVAFDQLETAYLRARANEGKK